MSRPCIENKVRRWVMKKLDNGLFQKTSKVGKQVIIETGVFDKKYRLLRGIRNNLSKKGILEGEFKIDDKNDYSKFVKGKCTVNNIAILEGTFEGEFLIEGKYTDLESNYIYVGKFKNYRLYGNGKMYKNKKLYASGEFKAGKLVRGYYCHHESDGTVIKFDTNGNVIQDSSALIERINVLTTIIENT